MREPFNLRLEEIDRLDRFVIHYVYFHPTDPKTGGLRIRSKDEDGPVTLSAEGLFRARMRRWPFTEKELDALWREEEAKRKG